MKLIRQKNSCAQKNDSESQTPKCRSLTANKFAAIKRIWATLLHTFKASRNEKKKAHRGQLRLESLEHRQMLAADVAVIDVMPELLDADAPAAETAELQIAESASAEGIDENLSTQQSDVVLQWNNLFNELLVENETQQNPGYASRAMAMMNLAIYDAVTLASGNPNDAFYEYDAPQETNANIHSEVAASQAAYVVLSSLYPDQQETIDSFAKDLFAGFRQNSTTAASMELGTTIGETVIAARANDGWDSADQYSFTDSIGDFQADPLNPDVPVWGPGWGNVEPFVVSSAEDFAPASPPDISSEEYATSYAEVQELGSVDSQSRTADQTEAGIFWAYDRVGLGTPMSLFNDVLETIAVQQGNSLEENAALFAQASVAMADAGIVAWHTKFDEAFWRPVTAIHNGDADGNALTEGDTEWTALGAPDGGDDIIGFTPQFPTYISGHATFGGALFGAIQSFYGTDDISFTLASKELEVLLENPELQEAYGLQLEDAERTFDTLSEAMAENGRSRVYLGIHFDFDDLVGQEVGQAVANTVSSEFVVASAEDQTNERARPLLVEIPRSNRPVRVTFDDGAINIRANGETTSTSLDSETRVVFRGTRSADNVTFDFRDESVLQLDRIVINAGGGNDRIRIIGVHSDFDGELRLNGGRGNDQLRAVNVDAAVSIFGQAGNDTIFGGNMDDRLSGGGGRDRIFGGSGNDRLNGGNGNDLMDGGQGRDEVVEMLSSDRVVDNRQIRSGRNAVDRIMEMEDALFVDMGERFNVDADGFSGRTRVRRRG